VSWKSKLAVFLLACAALPGLESGPSRAELVAAAARAVGSHDPDPFTRNPDWLANPLLGPSELLLIAPHPISRAVDQDIRIAILDAEVLNLTRMALVRTRFIDEHLERTLRDDVAQVVILNAGFDTRPYRFRALLKGKKVFEIDDAATQALKKQRVQDVFGAPPPNVTFAPLTGNLREVLRKAGFRGNAKTCFIWEDASMYANEGSVRATLRAMAESAPGSTLLMDYAGKNGVALANQDPNSSQVRWDAQWGEPWLFGVPEGREAEFFRAQGWEPRDTLPILSPDAARHYLTHRDGSLVGPPPGPGAAFGDSLGQTVVELTVAAPHHP
jgi:methyltransferase (TIGR00027 family)